MNDTRTAWKVGAFIVIALGLLAATLMVFSKNQRLFTPTYTLRVRAENVGGLKPRSSVLISGVRVGSVTDTELSPDGKVVNILIEIEKRYRIHRDAQFTVEQIGFLGDQFIVIYPGENQGPVLQDGDEVECRPPFNIQALAMTTVGFVQRVDEATKLLKETIVRVNQHLLTEQTLTNMAAGVGAIRDASERAIALVDHLDRVVTNNAAPFHVVVTNLARFSDELNRLSSELRTTISESRPALTNTLHQMEQSARSLGALARQAETGKGLAGALLQDDDLRDNLAATASNLATLSSNLAKYGLLYKPKQPKTTPDRRPPYPGYSPTRP